MGIKIEDAPDGNTRICWYEGDFMLQYLDLDCRLPLDQLHRAERVLNYYFGEWIFDCKSKFHKPFTEAEKNEWRTKRDAGWPFSSAHKR